MFNTITVQGETLHISVIAEDLIPRMGSKRVYTVVFRLDPKDSTSWAGSGKTFDQALDNAVNNFIEYKDL